MNGCNVLNFLAILFVDNWALLYAQKLAIKNEVPLYVCFCYDELCSKTWRHTDFMCKGKLYYAIFLFNILISISRYHGLIQLYSIITHENS